MNATDFEKQINLLDGVIEATIDRYRLIHSDKKLLSQHIEKRKVAIDLINRIRAKEHTINMFVDYIESLENVNT